MLTIRRENERIKDEFMRILGIETSCDETAAAVVEARNARFKILSNIVSSQVRIHAKYGGVVPEKAARLHIEKILAIIETALKKAGASFEKGIDCVAVCAGPGLISSLMVGVETAKTLAYVFKKPLVRINHLEGHIYSTQFQKEQQKFPAIALVVSGGHTQLYLWRGHLQYKLLGETIDDAAGEAFDKAAKILGLGYPGGPAISAYAEKVQSPKFKTQNEVRISLPRPMLNSGDFNFSFAGLKTAILYAWQKRRDRSAGAKAAFAQEFQSAAVDVLVGKTIGAARRFGVKNIVVAGGVSANQELRRRLAEAADKEKIELRFPDLNLTGDNAAMIAAAGFYRIKKKQFISPFKLKADPNWELV